MRKLLALLGLSLLACAPAWGGSSSIVPTDVAYDVAYSITATDGTGALSAQPRRSCRSGVAHLHNASSATVWLHAVRNPDDPISASTRIVGSLLDGSEGVVGTTFKAAARYFKVEVISASTAVEGDPTVLGIKCSNVAGGGGADPVEFASLPSSASVGDQRTVTDCFDASCAAGGGSVSVVKYWDGSTWANVGITGSGTDDQIAGEVPYTDTHSIGETDTQGALDYLASPSIFYASNYATGSSTGGIQEAIDAACLAGGHATVKVTDSVSMTALAEIDCDDMTLEGMGMGTVLTRSSNGTAIHINGDHVRVRDLTINFPTAHTSNVGILCQDVGDGCSEVMIENVQFDGSTTNEANSLGIAIDARALVSGQVKHSLFRDWEFGIYCTGESVSQCNANSIIDNRFKNIERVAIYVTDIAGNLRIEGNTIEGETWTGIICDQAGGVMSVTGNYFELQETDGNEGDNTRPDWSDETLSVSIWGRDVDGNGNVCGGIITGNIFGGTTDHDVRQDVGGSAKFRAWGNRWDAGWEYLGLDRAEWYPSAQPFNYISGVDFDDEVRGVNFTSTPTVACDAEAGFVAFRGDLCINHPALGTDPGKVFYCSPQAATGVDNMCDVAGEFVAIPGGAGGGGSMDDLIDDTTPQLGGDLDLNSNDITGTGDITITGVVTATEVQTTDVDGENAMVLDDNSTTTAIAPTGNQVAVFTAQDGELYKKDASDGSAGVQIMTADNAPELVGFGTTAADTDAIADGACDDQTVAVSGMLATDTITAFHDTADPTALTGADSLFVHYWASAGTLNFSVCNESGGSITPAARTFRYMVLR